MSEKQGSAVRWFAVSAAVLSAASMAGAHGLAWVAGSGHLSVVAVRAPTLQRTADGIDATPTGSVKPTALMIKIQ